MAGRVYVAAYIVLTPERLEREIRRLCWTPETGIAERFAASVCERRWQYHTSEDPSFFSARELASEGGCLSWGICRPNLRKPLREGDVVTFIGFEERDRVTYRFCAYATVARKVTPLMIWNDDDLVVYRKYLNLLGRPGADGSFEHHEPAPGFHEEWLCFMSDREGHRDDFRPY
jgi:hypothetical protein